MRYLIKINISIFIIFFILIIGNSCDSITGNEKDDNSYLKVSGVISTTLKYLEYEYDSHYTELDASNRSLNNFKYPYYNYQLTYDLEEEEVHQQFVKMTEDGYEYFFPINVRFNYDDGNKTFSNIYAEFCLIDTINQCLDTTSIFIIEGLLSD